MIYKIGKSYRAPSFPLPIVINPAQEYLQKVQTSQKLRQLHNNQFIKLTVSNSY